MCDYENTRVGFDSSSDLELYVNLPSIVSIHSDSTNSGTEFETLDPIQSDRYGDYARLSKDVGICSTQGAVLYQNAQLNNVCEPVDSTVTSTARKGNQNKNKSRSHQKVLYANDTMLQHGRDSIAPPVPRRKRKGHQVVRRISTVPSAVLREVHEWPRVKTAALILISFVIGAGIVLATIYIPKFIDTITKDKTENDEESDAENGLDGETVCKTIMDLDGCKNKIHGKDIKESSEHFLTNCTKIRKKIIDSRTYIFYEDGISFSKAVDFCHRTVRLKMLEIESSDECKDLQNHMYLNISKGLGYWTGQWNQGQDMGNRTIWPHVQPEDNVIVTDQSVCVFLPSRPQNCSRQFSEQGCFEKKIPVCKC